MPNFYTYLISSLPMLHFGIKPPFSFERFMEICQDKISQDEVNLLKATTKAYAYEGIQVTLEKWRDFETALRNELVRVRASRKHIDPLKYIRGEGYVEPFISRLAMNAYRNPSILETEKLLDQERWQMLDELAVGHYFDLDFLIVYALKLLILERWVRINSADSAQLLEEIFI